MPKNETGQRDLPAALLQVAVEVNRCADCGARRVRALNEDDGVAADACLEAMLVHARAVLEFLLSSSSRTSDICRSDFPCPDWDFPSSGEADAFRTDMTTINKHLTHLTWERLDPAQGTWEEEGFAARVVALAQRWNDHLAETDMGLSQFMRPWLRFSRQALGIEPSDDVRR